MLSLGHGCKVRIGEGFIINSGGKYSIDNLSFTKINIAPGATFTVGAYSGMSNPTIQCLNKIEIGDHVNIGAGCMLLDSDFHSMDWQDRADRKRDASHAKTAPISIGDYVFIGARSIILKGVSIGSRSAIAAGSVVVSDIPADCLAGGNPCKVIRYNTDKSLDDATTE